MKDSLTAVSVPARGKPLSMAAEPAWVIPVLALLGYLALAHCWAGSPFVLHQWDTLFDADANKYFEWFTRGRPDLGRVDALHPLLAQLIGWPIRLATLPLGAWSHEVQISARTELALAVCPIAAALSLALQMRALVWLGCSRTRQILMGALSAVSLGMLVFGSLPEQFALSAVAVSSVLYMVARDIAGQAVPMRWLLLGGWAASGVVLSNLAVFALLFLHLQWQRVRNADSGARLITALWRAAGYFIVVGLLTLATSFFATWLERTLIGSLERPHLSTGLNGRFLFKKSALAVGLDVLVLPARGLSLSGVAVLKQKDLPFPEERPPETLNNPAVISEPSLSGLGTAIAIMAALALSLGIAAWGRLFPHALPILLGLWLIYWPILLTYSGGDLFLFSLHVLPPALMLLAPESSVPVLRKTQNLLLLLLVVACSFANLNLMRTLLTAVGAYG